MSMLASLEVRVPILDHLFLEWVTGLPSEWKMRGAKQKYIFTKLAQRVGVPMEVLDRPKKGFTLPLRYWMRNELKDLIMSVLLDSSTLQRGYFNPKGVRGLLNEHFQGRRDHSARIWRFLTFELWHRNFMANVGVPGEATEETRGAPLRGGG
jgi:asparagine synthase (glutamine-hydrolysing)